MFKSFLVSLLVILFACSVSLAFWEYEPHFYMVNNDETDSWDIDERISIYTADRINDTYGTFAWMIISQYFASGYGGLLYNPTPWLEIGVGAGAEQSSKDGGVGGSDNPYYLGGSIGSFGEKYMAQVIFEHGLDHYWYSMEAMYRIHNNISVGGISQRFDGSGPQIRLHYKNASIFAAPLFRAWEESTAEQAKILTGITFSF